MNAPTSNSRIGTVPARLLPLLVGPLCAALFVGCASVRENVGGWFGMGAPAAGVPPEARTPATVLYAGGGNLRVFSRPTKDAEVLGTLSRHEKVTRTGLKNGFAYVENARGDLQGWVVNSRLIAQLPAAEAARTSKSAAKTKAGAKPANGAAAGEAEEPAPAAAPESEPAPAPPPARAEEPRSPAEGSSGDKPAAPPQPVAADAEPEVPAPSRVPPVRPKPAPQGTGPSIFDAY